LPIARLPGVEPPVVRPRHVLFLRDVRPLDVEPPAVRLRSVRRPGVRTPTARSPPASLPRGRLASARPPVVPPVAALPLWSDRACPNQWLPSALPGRFALALHRQYLEATGFRSPGSRRLALPRWRAFASLEWRARPTSPRRSAPRRSRPARGSAVAPYYG